MQTNDNSLNSIHNHDLVSIKEMGNIVELCYIQRRNTTISIKKINENQYINLQTGDIMTCNHIENRSQNKFQVGQSLKRLRDYINTNVTQPLNCKWITLTYRENMTDAKQLYNDFEKFIKRLRYKFHDFKIEYIVAMEPQGRGAYHAHLILIFDKFPGFIPNSVIEELWGHGFTSTHKLDNIDNIGAYLTAYLGDIELDNDNLVTYLSNNYAGFHGNNFKVDIKEVTEIDGNNLENTKRFIKGGRLYLYPPKFNIYRVSKGIKKPEKRYLTYGLAKKMLGIYGQTPNFNRTININDTSHNFSNIIIYEQYNRKRFVQ